ncbi:aminoglycoside phosphotransferase family protein, partial [bacterium]|nr:aminoglycoside phosphotransferase family protein [bacterium]
INCSAFQKTDEMLENTVRVSRHLARHPESSFPATLEIVSTTEGKNYLACGGDYWRTYRFIEGSESHDLCQGEGMARSLGAALGEYLSLLRDFPGEELSNIHPGFQDTRLRWQQLEKAFAGGGGERKQRGAALREEMEQLLDQAAQIADAVRSGQLPQQVTHGDTKVNNFLFRSGTNEVLALVDIDLAMWTTPLFDFGDLIRSASAIGREDEPKLDRVGIDISFTRALVEGVLSSRFPFSAQERDLLPYAGFSVSFNLATRFLADYLRGDTYFPTTSEHHNLDRAQAQWKITTLLFEGIPELQDELQHMNSRAHNLS